MNTAPNFQDADAFYERLLDAHYGLSREQSEALNAPLILLMANQIGNADVLQACIAAAVRQAPQRQTAVKSAGWKSLPTKKTCRPGKTHVICY